MGTLIGVVTIAVVFLSFANGSNDNFKGVATLYGSGTASYRVSLCWASITTLAGALLAPVRNSDHPDRRNRRMAIAETGGWRSPKPGMAIAETGHPDHRNR